MAKLIETHAVDTGNPLMEMHTCTEAQIRKQGHPECTTGQIHTHTMNTHMPSPNRHVRTQNTDIKRTQTDTDTIRYIQRVSKFKHTTNTHTCK